VITCEFIKGSKKDYSTGFTDHDVMCGQPAAQYRCQGELAAIVMPLCEQHKNFVERQYKWRVEVVVEQAR
jgi:hypothetical protein